MKNLKKFTLKNLQFIKGGIDPIILEEEFDLWKSSLSEEQTKEIITLYNGSADALMMYYKTVVRAGN
ncbi:MAG: hypothetical protein WCP57_08740 [Bacteroidota bacterium]